jgi:hypothetical protein
MSTLSTSAAEPGGDDASLSSEDGAIGFSPEDRERTIPLRVADLNHLLKSDPHLSDEDRERWTQFSRLVAAVFHHEFHGKLQELKERYAPLDPDSDCVNLHDHSRMLTDDVDESFLELFEQTLIRANYRRLDVEALKEAVSAPNELGLNYVPNFKLFEHLKVYVRGDAKLSRTVRGIASGFRKRTVVYNGYQRLVVAIKFRPGKHLVDYVRADALYLRMFKDVPHVDMEMHLPEQGTKVRMRLIDKAQIASPFAVSIPTVAFKLMGAAILTTSFGIATLVAAPLSAGLNSFFGFQRAKQRHLHRMIRHLYYLTLANNASVVTRIIDCAEEEETKEALLAYFVLWRGAHDVKPWDQARLDSNVETLLRERAGLSVDFEVGDALQKLYRLGLITNDSRGHLASLPIADAIAELDRQWDSYFARGLGGREAAP